MAESPSHRFGQIVGALLEEILLPVLESFCSERGLYLDRHGERVGVRAGKKVSWKDKYGNIHDLDFVIEKNGSATKRGSPVAFVEAAWRRYTKHSRNKVQEIQGAVLPIAEKYEFDSPFLGVVLAGVFTRGSLDQLESMGIKVVYVPYETVVAAFKTVGIDVKFDESTSDSEYVRCAKQIEGLTVSRRDDLKTRLRAANQAGFDIFFAQLRSKLDRLVEKVLILLLFGSSFELGSVTEAVSFISTFESVKVSGDFQKYEIVVVFSNGDELRGSFSSRLHATEFLQKFV
jgi:hypothetical protein